MTIFLSILSYVVVFGILAVVPAVVGLVLFGGFMALGRRFKTTRPIIACVTTAVGTVLAFWCFTTLADHTSLRVSIAMILLPAGLACSNSRARIRRAKAGHSNVRSFMRASGEAASYDQESDVQTERGYLCGDVAGYIVGSLLFLRAAPLF